MKRRPFPETYRCRACDGAGCPECCHLGRRLVGCTLSGYLDKCRCEQCKRTDSDLGVDFLYDVIKHAIANRVDTGEHVYWIKTPRVGYYVRATSKQEALRMVREGYEAPHKDAHGILCKIERNPKGGDSDDA